MHGGGKGQTELFRKPAFSLAKVRAIELNIKFGIKSNTSIYTGPLVCLGQIDTMSTDGNVNIFLGDIKQHKLNN